MERGGDHTSACVSPPLFGFSRRTMDHHYPEHEALLYRPPHEHHTCGVGFVPHISGRPHPDIAATRGLRVAGPPHVPSEAFERLLYLCRRQAERAALGEGIGDFYVPSFSSRTLVYKGLMVAPQLTHFYPDLEDPLFESALALFHQRYSTNTFPTWFLAQPFRFLCHNGEINTRQGNQNWMRAREPRLRSDVWGDRLGELLPAIQPGGSDSSDLDNVFALLGMSGRDPLPPIILLVPKPAPNLPTIDPGLS